MRSRHGGRLERLDPPVEVFEVRVACSMKVSLSGWHPRRSMMATRDVRHARAPGYRFRLVDRRPWRLHNVKATQYCSGRKPQAPEGQSEDPNRSPRTGAGAYACRGTDHAM